MEFIEAGIIVNTHGVRGTVKIEPWTNTPEFLRAFKRLFIGGIEYAVIGASVHKNHVLATLRGVETVQEATALRGKKVSFAKEDADLEEGEHFVEDLIGLTAVNDETGESFGKITDFLPLPSNGVYVVDTLNDGHGDTLIPAVAEFVKKIDVENGCIRFRLIEGL